MFRLDLLQLSELSHALDLNAGPDEKILKNFGWKIPFRAAADFMLCFGTLHGTVSSLTNWVMSFFAELLRLSCLGLRSVAWNLWKYYLYIGITSCDYKITQLLQKCNMEYCTNWTKGICIKHRFASHRHKTALTKSAAAWYTGSVGRPFGRPFLLLKRVRRLE